MFEGRSRRAYEETTARFIDRANAFLTQLANVESALGEFPPLTPHAGLGGKRRFYFTELMTLTSSNPLRILLDRIGPSGRRRRRVAARAEVYLTRLLETNASRVVSDLGERLRDSAHDLETEIRSRLTELVASAERAAARARELQAAGKAARSRIGPVGVAQRAPGPDPRWWPSSGGTGEPRGMIHSPQQEVMASIEPGCPPQQKARRSSSRRPSRTSGTLCSRSTAA